MLSAGRLTKTLWLCRSNKDTPVRLRERQLSDWSSLKHKMSLDVTRSVSFILLFLDATLGKSFLVFCTESFEIQKILQYFWNNMLVYTTNTSLCKIQCIDRPTYSDVSKLFSRSCKNKNKHPASEVPTLDPLITEFRFQLIGSWRSTLKNRGAKRVLHVWRMEHPKHLIASVI
jgi:hypothetical protein